MHNNPYNNQLHLFDRNGYIIGEYKSPEGVSFKTKRWHDVNTSRRLPYLSKFSSVDTCLESVSFKSRNIGVMSTFANVDHSILLVDV